MRALAVVLVVALAPAAQAGGRGMYLSIGKDGTPIVTDYPHGDAVKYQPGDFDKIAMHEKGVPHLGLGRGGLRVSGDDDDFGGPPVQITLRGAPPKSAPPAPAIIEGLLVKASAKYGVPLPLVRAVVAVESAFRVDAVSRVGAQGLMQLMPDTAADLGVKDPFDPEQNINGGTRYLSFLLKHFKSEALAVAAYNAGPARVARDGAIPEIPETQAYVESVLGLRRAYEGMLTSR